MFRSIVQLPAVSSQKWLGGTVLGLSVLLFGTATKATATPSTVLQDTHSPMVVAQLFQSTPSSCTAQGCKLSIDQNILQTGQQVVARYSGKDRQVIQTGETRNLTLNLSEPVRNQSGQIVIPADSLIEGEVVPVKGGGQFVANRIVINGASYSFSAQSDLLADTKDPNQADIGAIATDAAIGAAGGILVGQVLGQGGVTVEQVLGGAVAGGVIGNVTAPQAVVINNGDTINLRMTNTFRL